mmetsp:Transcript_24739/g.53800  ORF Transcript_24739/g.53800 Transcript_24739/m.53800 type:complete len:518 (-) Transcript_24739:260-1813(-)|eukprot:CAMPEP_0206458508 /NCGR_PEP_ID=MMETSP0324_2-20121206/23613_1 /ASSEMBLY_ACC=CAM_ASM_000836 /TAXON_ID=2866 /ORGANISM="Crypthecodinium cohnii, Strain Seligo" /LENGTH=517 /DNA_ID=CAMNT_0053929863 /DNA_START=86 /DNA_END=1639 /DNA_ORIENTATION=+
MANKLFCLVAAVAAKEAWARLGESFSQVPAEGIVEVEAADRLLASETVSSSTHLADGLSCAVNVSWRTDCGHYGITVAECYAKGCCYAEEPPRPNEEHRPWCYHAWNENETESPPTTTTTTLPSWYGEGLCASDLEDREDCGHYGITRTECWSRGCCYAEEPPRPNEDNIPYCYKTLPVTTTITVTTTSTATSTSTKTSTTKTETTTSTVTSTTKTKTKTTTTKTMTTTSTETATTTTITKTTTYTKTTTTKTTTTKTTTTKTTTTITTPAWEGIGLCETKESARVDCGYFNIKVSDCYERGCCYEKLSPNPDNVPFCFYPGAYNGTDIVIPTHTSTTMTKTTTMAPWDKAGLCEREESDRQDCGYWDIPVSECYERGCCYEEIIPNENNVPWCFYPLPYNGTEFVIPTFTKTTTTKTSTTPAWQADGQCEKEVAVREDCGFFGITVSQCYERGCCYEMLVPNPDDLPYCYYPEGYQQPEPEPEVITTTTTVLTSTARDEKKEKKDKKDKGKGDNPQ